jgi:putative ubiquitin-RnfH superfamily antitoxin RatB of RatAB toxin-antitoxin module
MQEKVEIFRELLIASKAARKARYQTRVEDDDEEGMA